MGAFLLASATVNAEALPPPFSTLTSRLSPEERQSLRQDIERWSTTAEPDRPEIDARRHELRALARERFRQADLNRDNCLDPLEIDHLNPRLTRHFPHLDRNGDGLVSFDEFLDAINDRRHHAKDSLR